MGADTKALYRRLKGGSSMLSEADLITKRAASRWLTKPHPQWTHHDLADALSMSRPLSRALGSSGCIKLIPMISWRGTPAHERGTRHLPPSPLNQPSCSVSCRSAWRRLKTCSVFGVPEAIRSSVHRDLALQQARVRLPRSQTTSLHEPSPSRLPSS
jgi:hypothetical protein